MARKPAVSRLRGKSPWKGAPVTTLAGSQRILNVPPDIFDGRDRLYLPTLAALPARVDGRAQVPKVLDQGSEGACTGFAMAALANLLLRARGKKVLVSPRFLYENARRYDEWKGEEYEGSSLRGAMKGFLRHGVCRERTLPYVAGQVHLPIPDRAVREAGATPIGAYYRVATSSINDLQCAIFEAGAVAVCAEVHAGWDAPKARKKGDVATVPWAPGTALEGGHAFLLIGYDDEGFLIQNSWGSSWGTRGFARLLYEDWIENRTDAWVAQLGIGTVAVNEPRTAIRGDSSALAKAGPPEKDIHLHYLPIEDGHFDEFGTYRFSQGDLLKIAQNVAAFGAHHGGRARVLIYAHGGLNTEASAAEKTLDFKEVMTQNGIYPIHLLWHTGLLETLADVAQPKAEAADSALIHRAGGPLQWISEKLKDALDEGIEALARLPGRAAWRDMKRDAERAVGTADRNGPLWQLLDVLKASAGPLELHLVGHSAGAVLFSHALDWFEVNQTQVQSLTCWAPAVALDLFKQKVQPRVGGPHAVVKTFAVHHMKDKDERDDHCVHAYHKSLLYFVSNSFEEEVPTPLLGLARNIQEDYKGGHFRVDNAVKNWLNATPGVQVITARPIRKKSGDSLHGAFDEDPETVNLTIARMKGEPANPTYPL